MATNNRTADVLLKFQVDSASVNRVRASFNALDTELDDLRSSLLGVGTAAQQGVNGLRQRFAAGEASVESMQDEVEQLRRELLALDDVNVTPTVDVQTASGGRLQGGLNAVDQIGRLGSQVGGGLGASGLGNAVNLVGDLAGAASTLNPIMIGAAAAIGVFSIAVTELQKQAEEAAAKAAAAIEGNRAALEQRGNTIPENQARQQELLGLIDFEERSIAAREAQIAANDATYAQVQYTNALGVTTTDLVSLGNALNADSDQARVSIGQSNAEITRLTAEFLGLSKRSEELQREMQATADGLVTLAQRYGPAIQGAVDLGVGLLRFNQNVRTIQTTIENFRPLIDGIGAYIDKQREAYQAQQAALQTDNAGSYLNAITETVKAQELLTKAQEAYNAEVSASAGRIAEINRKLQDDLAQAETERQSDLAEAARQAGEDRVKATEDAEKERLRIQKRFDRSYNQAVEDRDALAAVRAKEQRDDELDQLNDRYKDQLKTVDKSLAQQQRTIEARYASQVATINAAAQAAVRTEQAASQARLAALQQGVQAAQVALINAQQAEYLIRANFYNQAVSQAQVWANLMQLYTSYGFSLPGGSGGTKPGLTIIGKATGGPVQAATPYIVGEKGPELFVPAQSGRIIPNGAGMTINVVGAQQDTIRVTSRQQAIAVFNSALDKLGVA